MKTHPVIPSLFCCLLAAACSNEPADPAMTMGDGTVRGQLLRDYEFSWRQCTFQEGEWADGGLLAERLSTAGDRIAVVQTSKPPSGITNVATTEFDRESLAPLRMHQEVTAPDGSTLATVEREFTETGYSGEMRRGDQTRKLTGAITSAMWHGGALGLPLATIDEERYPVEFPSAMVAFDGTYRTIATLADRETIRVGDTEAEALLVDVEWHHNESGDVYAPGPDASGGRYWLLPKPPEGMPYVPQYKTDTYMVTVLSDSCPDSQD